MKEVNRRRHERLRRALRGEPEFDTIGWEGSTTWAAIRLERELRAEEAARERQVAAEKASPHGDDAPMDDAKPDDTAPIGQAPRRPLPAPDPPAPPPPPPIFTPDADTQRRIDYANEKARWRLRTRDDDFSWERERGGVIHEYDPLAEES